MITETVIEVADGPSGLGGSVCIGFEKGSNYVMLTELLSNTALDIPNEVAARLGAALLVASGVTDIPTIKDLLCSMSTSFSY